VGGVEVPWPRGLAGHSDADVLLHAIMDALLGAAGYKDIGHHFPPHDPAYAGADSLALLGQVVDLVRKKGLRVGNVDAVVLAQEPVLAPYLEGMRHRIASALGVGEGRVNIKAKSPEGLGELGQGQGMAALAVAILEEV